MVIGIAIMVCFLLFVVDGGGVAVDVDDVISCCESIPSVDSNYQMA